MPPQLRALDLVHCLIDCCSKDIYLPVVLISKEVNMGKGCRSVTRSVVMPVTIQTGSCLVHATCLFSSKQKGRLERRSTDGHEPSFAGFVSNQAVFTILRRLVDYEPVRARQQRRVVF